MPEPRGQLVGRLRAITKQPWLKPAIGVAFLVGIAIAANVVGPVTSTRDFSDDEADGERVPRGRKSGYSDVVREHSRMQAHGPGRSQRSEVQIASYERGNGRAG
jgi:hypothetical protein